jgi:hypothetical protein
LTVKNDKEVDRFKVPTRIYNPLPKMSAELPVASPIRVSPVPVKRERRVPNTFVKKPEPEPVVEEKEEEEEVDEEVDAEVMIKKSDYDALLARVEALEKKKKVKEVKAKKSAHSPHIPTKDAILRNILRDGESVFAKELINTGDRKGEYIVWEAVFHTLHNGFLIKGTSEIDVNNEQTWGLKRMYVMSPTTLCSRFRYLMKEKGMCGRGASTTCGFAKCYVERDGVQIKLNKLW